MKRKTLFKKREAQFNNCLFILADESRKELESLNSSTCCLLNFIIIQAKKGCGQIIDISLEHFMSVQGLSDKDKAIAKLRDSLETLFHLDLKFFYPGRNPNAKIKNAGNTVVFDAVAYGSTRLLQSLDSKGPEIYRVELSYFLYHIAHLLPSDDYPSIYMGCKRRGGNWHKGGAK